MRATKRSTAPAPPDTAMSGHDRDTLAPAPRRFSAYGWSLLALVLGLGLTMLLRHQQIAREQAAQELARSALVDKSSAALVTQLQAAESLLRAVQSLFLSSDEVSEREFANIYANLKPRRRFPSLQALAYARKEVRADGVHYVTTWVQPLTGNAALAGLDINTQPNNLLGVIESRDTDLPALSAPFRLAQQVDTLARDDGITLRMPIFSPGPPPASLAERRRREAGSLAVSFRVSGLIGNALSPDVTQVFRVRITDVTDAREWLLFDSTTTAPVDGGKDFHRRLAYGGRVWRMDLQPRATAQTGFDLGDSALPVGVLASVLLAMLVFTIASTRQRAIALAWHMTSRYRESEERFRALNDLLPALVLLADGHDSAITYANRASRERLGESVGERRLSDLFEDPHLFPDMRQPGTRDFHRISAALCDEQGLRFWADVALSKVVLDGADKLLMVAIDVTEQRQLNEMLSFQASHDALTELYNRREFESRLQSILNATETGTPMAVLLYIDLDQFKLINDTSGHIAGDHLLAQLAATMHKQLSATDVLARLGGDEFGVLALGVRDRQDAEAVAERVRHCIDEWIFVWEQRSYTVSASIGVVMIDQPGMTMKDLLARADTACYMAKELGRNRVHFYSERDDEAARRRGEMEWANRLRWAIEERRLVLVYQELTPLSPRPGSGPRVELLLRFRDDSGALVLPGVFMPAAERYSLMPMLDRWVVETALAHFDQLHPAGADLRLATINLSGASVEDDALADLIIALLEKHAVEPSRVCFEITETVAVRNLSRVARFMEQLRQVGCKTALDDFGVGMSSFAYLKNLPIDIIKIDGSFIRDMLTDPVSHAIVRAVADIGQRLGLEVVAEWVADDETLRVLTAMGVSHAQGFSLHAPEPARFQYAGTSSALSP
jgi:diguanylate cyclase (GGDEF)-like protein